MLWILAWSPETLIQPKCPLKVVIFNLSPAVGAVVVLGERRAPHLKVT